MGNFTLSNIASDKNNAAAKRGDLVRAHIGKIIRVDGFNIRTQDDELREHVASIAGAIAAGMPIPSLEVWVNPETGDLELVDGYCRHEGYLTYAEHDPKFDGFVPVVEFKGTPLQRKMRIASSNKQLKLKPVELGRLYMDARDNLGASRQEIAIESGVSVAHVDQLILLASGAAEIHEAIERKEISATEAVKLVRDHGSGAPAELERRKEVAKENGSERITAKTGAQKKVVQSRPKVDLVVSNAVVLVSLLNAEQLALCDQAECSLVSVNSHALADLIMAVRGMQQAGKSLDADRQVEMPIE